jgi:hypothetical protein
LLGGRGRFERPRALPGFDEPPGNLTGTMFPAQLRERFGGITASHPSD